MLEIRDATYQDLDRIAEIHSFAIPYSLNAIMGFARLKSLYLDAMNDKSSQLLVAIQNDVVVGFISGTSDFLNLAKRGSRSISVKQINQLVRKLNPWRILLAVIDLVLVSRSFKNLGEVYYLSTWSVVPGTDPIAGSRLFREIFFRVKNEGTRTVVVNVSKSNVKVLRMYRSLGFLPVSKTISEIILKKDF